MKPHDLPPTAADSQTSSRWPTLPPPVRVPLTQLGGHPCPYLPNRVARDLAFLADAMPPAAYHRFMDAGFRRSGKVVYQPNCRACRACRPVRVRVADFRATKSLRRCQKRNADLTVTAGPLEPTEEKFDLYRRYQTTRHAATDHLDWPSFVDFLYDSPVNTREFCYRNAEGRLLAVGICDEAAGRSLSSVYFYYDPAESRRGLGTFGVLREIEHCQASDLPHYYLGFLVRGCDAMAYKGNFRPYQELGTDGTWRDVLPAYAPD